MIKRHLSLLVAGGFAVAVLAVAPVTVQAHEGHDHGNSTSSGARDDSRSGEPHKENGIANQQGSKRLTAAKKRVCENRKQNVTNIMERRVSWAERHLELFSTIAERTQKFYDEKGNAIDNYDALVGVMTVTKAKAEADLGALRAAAVFDCDGEDPKGSVNAYKAALQQEKESLMAYRTAVKNLIVGVKSAQGEN